MNLNRNKYLIIVILLIISKGLCSQNTIPVSLFGFDKYSVNNAYGGLSGNRIFSFELREQWVGINQMPEYYMVTYSQPLYKYHGGVGGSIKIEQHGVQSMKLFNASYNYVLPTHLGLFSFGMGAGILNISIDYDKIVTPEGVYQGENFNHNDDFIENLLINNVNFYDFSVFGIFNRRNIEFGIVFDKKLLLNKDLSYKFHDFVRVNWQYGLKLKHNIYLKTFGLIYTDFLFLQNDIGITTGFRNVIAGLNLRGYSINTLDAMSIILGGNINSKLRLIYAYDLSLSALRSVEDGTHEFKITYNLGKMNNIIKMPPLIYNPRL